MNDPNNPIEGNGIRPESLISFRVEQRYNGIPIGHGTGFLRREQSRCFLITNWHVVTGRAPWEPSFFPGGGPGSPHQIVVHFTHLENRDLVVDSETIDLYVNDKPIWLEHPTVPLVDVVAIELTPPVGVMATNDLRHKGGLVYEVNSDLIILGFPFPWKVTSDYLPIWKRGSISSEPTVDIAGEPKMYADTACRPGMSGSPVFVFQRGQTVERYGSQTLFNMLGIDPSFRFIGVFSGAVIGPTRDAQLAIVWKDKAIKEIVTNGIPGKNPFPP